MVLQRWTTSLTGRLVGVLVGVLVLAPAMSLAHTAPLALPVLLALGLTLLARTWRTAAADLGVGRRGVVARSGTRSASVVSRQADPDAAGRARPRAPCRGRHRTDQPPQ